MVMLTLEESRTRWQKTIERAPNLADLKLAVRFQNEKSPCVSGLRSVCWKIFILFHTIDSSTWSAVLTDTRSAYTSLKEHFLKYVERPDEIGRFIDPLDDDKNSPWNILRKDEELRAEIQQDVERCMPEEPYFRQAETQRMLLDILFIFCKMNEDVGYRQGMHELLAPILWVVEIDTLSVVETHTGDFGVDAQILDMLNPIFLEHDAFTIFSILMQSAKSFYELGESDKITSNSLAFGNNQTGTSPIVARSKRIHEIYLASLDPELANHLTTIEVLPQIFLIRWIRILFGREFAFNSLLSLWDVLFAEDPALDLVDMICVAMLLRIRWQLLEADYSAALTLLLKYPVPDQPHGPQTFVEDAISLRENFSQASAIKIINSHGGRSPNHYMSTSRPATAAGVGLNLDQRMSWRRSPLPSPARFMQHQGGVEAFLQGAAKGVFDRGERLGINKAVRDAVGEVKKNMQNLQTPSPPSSRKIPEGMRRSLDESRAAPSIRKTTATMEQRNKQLSQMLEDALSDLRGLSTVGNNAIRESMEAIDLAIAKVQFVQVYLEDSSMPLPTESLRNVAIPKSMQNSTVGSITPEGHEDPLLESEDKDSLAQKFSNIDIDSQAHNDSALGAPGSKSLPSTAAQSSTSNEGSFARPARPRAPIPTRSTLAQSSFAFMLEPDGPSLTTAKPSSPKSASPFLASGRRPLSGGSREKAFLFGSESEEGEQSSWNSAPNNTANQDYNLGTIRRSKG